MNFFRAIKLKIYQFKLKRNFYSKNKANKCLIAKSSVILGIQRVELGHNVEIQDYVIIKALKNKISIGDYSQLNPFVVLYGGSGINIGKYVMIAPHCTIVAGNHDHIQTEIPMRMAGGLSKGKIIIKDDVWIGANSTILSGVTIEEGAVISANSVVNKSVEKFGIYGGIPAKKLGSRPK